MINKKGIEEAMRFLEDMEKEEKGERLRAEVNACKLISDAAAKLRYKFTDKEFDQALKEKWGLDRYDTCPLILCFSEAPGF